jgi:hypothetical protein
MPQLTWFRSRPAPYESVGDAAALVMKLNGRSFPEALSYLAGGPAPTSPVAADA